MAKTRLIVVRHGETAWNIEGRYQGQLDSPLTTTGVEESRALAARLEGEEFTALYASDLGRALKTAEIIAERTPCRIVTDSRLRERHLGVFQGLLKSEMRLNFAEEYHLFKTAGPEYVIPGGESATEASARMIRCLEELAQRHTGERIVVVTHGGVVSALLRHSLGLALGIPRRFERPNTAWNAFWWEDGRWFLETWGDVSHLGDKGSS
jgi:2,3-bisphosphoglycerate-dependent phosphoglycerate mutase